MREVSVKHGASDRHHCDPGMDNTKPDLLDRVRGDACGWMVAAVELKPKLPTLRGIMLSAAFIFGSFAATKLIFKHDLNNGLWSFAVCLALVLGILLPWLTGHRVVDDAVKPEKYSLFGQ